MLNQPPRTQPLLLHGPSTVDDTADDEDEPGDQGLAHPTLDSNYSPFNVLSHALEDATKASAVRAPEAMVPGQTLDQTLGEGDRLMLDFDVEGSDRISSQRTEAILGELRTHHFFQTSYFENFLEHRGVPEHYIEPPLPILTAPSILPQPSSHIMHPRNSVDFLSFPAMSRSPTGQPSHSPFASRRGSTLTLASRRGSTSTLASRRGSSSSFSPPSEPNTRPPSAIKEEGGETNPEDALHAATMEHIDAYLPECASHMSVANTEEDIEYMQTLADPGLWEDLASLALRDMIITARCASTSTTYVPFAFLSLMTSSTRQ
jgi:hypothetical protein